MLKPTSLLIAAFVLLVTLPVVAEKPPMSPTRLRETATHVMVGKVTAIFEREETVDDWDYTRYVALAVMPAQQDVSAGPVVLVTGANRGLGLEFARQYKAAGATVIGTARKPAEADDLKALGVRVEQLDVTDAESVKQLAQRLGDMPIDILINNAGRGGRVQKIEEIDPDDYELTFKVNCLGPMRVTQALMPGLRKGNGKLVVNISSMLGSIESNTGGGYYGYRESKAGLNMFTRSIAAQLKPEGFTCIVMSPGWVRTRMGGPNAQLTPEESIGGMLSVMEKLTPEDTGLFFNQKGEKVAW